jgi:hypothetical protein
VNAIHSDALVFLVRRATLEENLQSLQAMVKPGRLGVPVIGVAKAGWNLDQLKARAKDNLEKQDRLDDECQLRCFPARWRSAGNVLARGRHVVCFALSSRR